MTYCYADINLPLCALAFTVVLIFLRLRKPPIESYKKVFFSVDWMYVPPYDRCFSLLTSQKRERVDHCELDIMHRRPHVGRDPVPLGIRAGHRAVGHRRPRALRRAGV